MMTNVHRAFAAATGDDEFAGAMDRFAQQFASYRERLPNIPYAYTRTLLHRTPRFEIVVMQWAAGSTSPIHDHGTSSCWVLLMEGSLAVENFECDDPNGVSGIVSLRETGNLVLNPGDVDLRSGKRELHRVANPTDKNAYTLQLYAAPIETYTVIDAHSHQTRVVTAMCDLELGGI